MLFVEPAPASVGLEQDRAVTPVLDLDAHLPRRAVRPPGPKGVLPRVEPVRDAVLGQQGVAGEVQLHATGVEEAEVGLEEAGPVRLREVDEDATALGQRHGGRFGIVLSPHLHDDARAGKVPRRGGDIVALRRFVGMTQEEFARAAGISVDTLQNWEQGRRRPQGAAIALMSVWPA